MSSAGSVPVTPVFSAGSAKRSHLDYSSLALPVMLHPVLEESDTVFRALENSLQPKPSIMPPDRFYEAQALTEIISCEEQRSRGPLVSHLVLQMGWCIFPPAGVFVPPILPPPMHKAIEVVDEFESSEVRSHFVLPACPIVRVLCPRSTVALFHSGKT